MGVLGSLWLLLFNEDIIILDGFFFSEIVYDIFNEFVDGLALKRRAISKANDAHANADRTQVGPMLVPWTLLSG